MAKLRVLLPFNGLIEKDYCKSFFRSNFAQFRPKIGHFSVFSFLAPVFSETGVQKVFIYISGFKKSYLKTLYFLVEFLYLFLENPKNRFISLSYCFFQKPEIFAKYMVVALSLGAEVIKILLYPDHLGLIEGKSRKIWSPRIFSPLLKYSPY